MNTDYDYSTREYLKLITQVHISITNEKMQKYAQSRIFPVITEYTQKYRQVWFVCGWQVKLCDPFITHRPYLSTLRDQLGIIKCYRNGLFTFTLLLKHVLTGN